MFASGGWGYRPDPPKEFQVGEPSVAESRLYSAGLELLFFVSARTNKRHQHHAKARPWCQISTRPRAWAGPAGPARNTRESVVCHFCGRESNCQILCRSLELLVWCFQKYSTSFFGFFFGVNGSVRKKSWLCGKVTCFCATDDGVSTRIENGAI